MKMIHVGEQIFACFTHFPFALLTETSNKFAICVTVKPRVFKKVVKNENIKGHIVVIVFVHVYVDGQ